MPAQGGVYLRDVSGHSVAIDQSGFLYVNVNGNLSVGNVNISGQVIALASGSNVISFGTPGPSLYSGAAAQLSGLQVVTTVNSTTNISGQTVYLTSGFNQVQLQSGNNQVLISGSPAPFSGLSVIVQSGLSIVSGQNVSIASGAIVQNSGQTVSFASGGFFASGIPVGISGQTVNTTVNVGNVQVSGIIAIVSGNIFLTSGNVTLTAASTANLSGLMVVISGNAATSVSGNVVTITSGNAGANLVVAGASGAGATFSGITVLAAITTNISGQQVYLGSGSNSVTFVSGFNLVALSGTSNFSGLGVVAQSGFGVLLASGNYLASGIYPASGLFLASGLIPNISGQAVSISGDQNLPVNSNPSMTSGFGYSGGLSVINAMYDLSGGHWVPLTNNTISGIGGALAVAQDPATKIFVGFSGSVVQSGITSNSGGEPLTGKSGSPISIPVFQVTVRNLSGNNTIYVGGSGSRPFSGFGFPLLGGDGLTMSISDASLIYVMCATSGQFASWIGSQY